MMTDGSKVHKQRSNSPRSSASPALDQAAGMIISAQRGPAWAHAVRLEYFRRAVAAGTYRVDSLTIADCMLRRRALLGSDML